VRFHNVSADLVGPANKTSIKKSLELLLHFHVLSAGLGPTKEKKPA
jgi:hypothetical protein